MSTARDDKKKMDSVERSNSLLPKMTTTPAPKTLGSFRDIRALHNQTRVVFYSIITFNKAFGDYYETHREKVIKPLLSLVANFDLNGKEFFYIRSKYDDDDYRYNRPSREKLVKIIPNGRLHEKKIYTISQETYYKIKAVKLIIQSIQNYDEKLTKYKLYLWHKIKSLIEMQNNFRTVYDYIINVSSNGHDFDGDSLEDFLVCWKK